MATNLQLYSKTINLGLKKNVYSGNFDRLSAVHRWLSWPSPASSIHLSILKSLLEIR